MWKYLLECMENEEEARNIPDRGFIHNGRVKKDNMILESIRRKFGIETIWHDHYMVLEGVLSENRSDVMSMLQKGYLKIRSNSKMN